MIAPTRIIRSDPHAQLISLLCQPQYPSVLDDSPVPFKLEPGMNVPHNFHPHHLTTRPPIVQSEFEPRPAALTSSVSVGVRAPSLILRIRRDDHAAERVREFPTLDGVGPEVSHVGVVEAALFETGRLRVGPVFRVVQDLGDEFRREREHQSDERDVFRGDMECLFLLSVPEDVVVVLVGGFDIRT